MTTIALAIPHCQFDPHRVKSLERLRLQLEISNDKDHGCARTAAFSLFPSVGLTPNWVWSSKMFEWMAQQKTEWVMQIQDDVILVPEFWDVLYAALAGLPTQAEAVSLFTIVPQAASFSQRMGCNWVTTTDWMTGPTWLVKTAFMREFVDLRSNRLRSGWDQVDPATNRLRSGLNEDTLLGLGCAALGRRIWNPLPALVDHNVELSSTYGNTGQRFNKASFNWKHWQEADAGNHLADLKDKNYWIPRNGVQGSKDTAIHLGCAYSFTTHNFLRWIHDDEEPFGDLPWDRRADAIRNDIVQLEVMP